MKYKTVIEVVTDAQDKNEAIELVGEYLSGNIVSGIDMKCRTSPAGSYRKSISAVAVVALILGISLLSLTQVKSSAKTPANFSGVNAIQPPLKTSAADISKSEFKKEWEKKQSGETLNSIAHIR